MGASPLTGVLSSTIPEGEYFIYSETTGGYAVSGVFSVQLPPRYLKILTEYIFEQKY
jgi:hypothetical protein